MCECVKPETTLPSVYILKVLAHRETRENIHVTISYHIPYTLPAEMGALELLYIIKIIKVCI